MNAAEVIKEAAAAGIRIAIKGSGLSLQASAPPPKAFIDLISEHKPEIVALLSSDRDGPAETQVSWVDMVVAIASTKIPLLLGTSPLPPPPVPPQVGFWAVLHEIRADDAQLLCSLFLLLVGAGPWALDALLARRRGSARAQEWQEATMPQGTCVTDAQSPINTLRT